MSEEHALAVSNVRQMTMADAQATFTPAERAVYDELSELVTKRFDEDLWWYYEMGKRVAKVTRDAKNNKTLYGEQLVERMSIALGLKSDTALRGALRVVDAYNKEAFTKVVNARGPAGNRLAWTTVCYLASVNDDVTRDALMKAALEQDWTSQEVLKEIQRIDEQRPNRGGRPHRIPTSAVNCLSQIEGMSRKLTSMFDDKWFGQRYNVAESLNDADAETMDARMTIAIEQAIAELTELQERVSVATAKLDKLLQRAQQLLKPASERDVEDPNLIPLANRRQKLPGMKPTNGKHKKGKRRAGQTGSRTRMVSKVRSTKS